MVQQLNLIAGRAAAPRPAWNLDHGALLAAGVLLLSIAATAGLQWSARRSTAQAHEMAQRAAPLRALLPKAAASGAAGGAAELAQLRAFDAAQTRIRGALESGIAGTREGYADYLVALARQASGAVWITGFAVADDGNVDLEGRMTDAAVLTDYLHRLNAEPRFKGRPFAQLSLNAMDSRADAPLPYTEFALRSKVAAEKGTP